MATEIRAIQPQNKDANTAAENGKSAQISLESTQRVWSHFITLISNQQN